jgi:uncharacterized protein YeaO (DUF488 family)
MHIAIARLYDEPTQAQGYRVLVDRLWPRGVSKAHLPLDEWAKDLAPSPELRTWFGHQPGRFEEFTARYRLELAANPAVSAFLLRARAEPTVTLLYAAKDPHVNHAVVLRDFLLSIV